MDLASGEDASREFIFVICIILLSLCAHDQSGVKYDCSQSVFHCFHSFLVCFFYLRVKKIYFFFLDFLERKSICLLAFPVNFPGVELLGLHDLFIDSLLVQWLPTEKPSGVDPGRPRKF